MGPDESLKRIYLVMDKASIPKSKPMVRNIKSRSYKVTYLPPYSPELNPIEIFQKVLKDRVKRGKLSNVETLTSKVIEGSEDVPIEHLQNFIQYSIDIFPKRLSKEHLSLF